MSEHKVFSMAFAKLYALYVQKAEKKNRTEAEVVQIICWLTGYDPDGLASQLESENDLPLSLLRRLKLIPMYL